MNKGSTAVAFSVGCGILSFVFLVVLLTSAAFLLGGGVHPALGIVSLLLATALVYYLLRASRAGRPQAWLAVFIVIVLGCIAVASVTLDRSWDGNSYHKVATGELAHGWNPVRMDVNTFNKSPGNSFKLAGNHGLDRALDTPWINHYPKASWIFAATIYRLSGNIESGKSIALLVAAALFLLAYSYLAQKLSRNQALLASLLLALNPVTAVQITSYYVDGVMGNLLLIVLLGCVILLDSKAALPYRKFAPYGLILMAAVLAINLKFTGLVYTAIILAVYGAYVVAQRQWRETIRLAATGAAVLFIGILIVGASSYVKNTVMNGNPLYPLMGKGSVDLITGNQPIGYEHMPYLQRFIKGNLAPTEQIDHLQTIEHGAPGIKVPFSINPNEITYLDNVDTRQGGNGVWFGGILIVATIAVLYYTVRYAQTYRRESLLYALPLISLAISVLAVNGTWWARYLPQLIVFPVIVLVALYRRGETILPGLLAYALLFNVTLMFMMNLHAQSDYHQATQQSFAANLHCDGTKPVRLYSSIGLDGSLYTIHDICQNISLMTPAEFKAAPANRKVMLYNGVFVVH